MSIHQLSRTRLVVHFLNDCVHGIKQHSLNDYVTTSSSSFNYQLIDTHIVHCSQTEKSL